MTFHRSGRSRRRTGGSGMARTPHLPHEQRTREQLAQSPRLVGAHIMQPYRLSVSNGGFPDYYDKHFMPPGGTEGGVATHPTYGGFWRERPLKHVPRPRPESDWRKADRRDEVSWAIDIGLDVFHNDILTAEGTSTNWVNGTMELLEAVERPEFNGTLKYIPMIDGTAGIGTSVTNAIRSIGTIIKRPGVYKRDGFPVVMSFAPESVSGTTSDQDWWVQLYNGVKADYGVDIRTWHNYNAAWRPQADLFDPQSFVIGHGRWGGNRGWSSAQDMTSIDLGGAPAHCRATYTKKLYCFPVTTQDARWDQQRWWEAWCTTSLRKNFEQARRGAAEMVQIVTWNDFRETGMMPQQSGWGWPDLVSFFLEWYKFDAPPTIVREAVYLTHREHRIDLATTSVQSVDQTKFLPTTTDSQGAAKFDVEALCFIKNGPCDVPVDVAGTVTTVAVTQAMIDAAAGGPVSVMVPHHVGASGTVSARMVRGGATVPGTAVTSQKQMSITPLVQNFWYYCTSSLRS